MKMSVKLVILKTGEQIVADVKELVSSPNEEEATLHAYLLSNAFKIEYNKPILLSEQQNPEADGEVRITLSPWLILSNDKMIPVRADCVMTIIDPIKSVVELYEERTNEESDQVSFTEE
tara:strand:+ start:309 stop:665 length:357 start_codon:yes stop_codon:yes gene_type:complete